MYESCVPAMLSNYSSLWEVFTAFFCSMLLSDILGGIWTPEYKRNVSGLIKQMGIPFVASLTPKLRNQINANVKEISGHMHRRAIFMVFFSVCLLILTGAERNMGFNPTCETEILFWSVLLGLLIVVLGKFTFSNYIITAITCILYGVAFFLLCHYGHNFSLTWSLLADEKYAIGGLLFFLCVPIVWQIISCWIYSSLYYGRLLYELHQEELLYKRAIIGIRTRSVDVIPEKYKVRAAVDITAQVNSEADISYENCDDVLYQSVDALLENPVPIKIFISWVGYRLKMMFRRVTFEDSEFVNQQFESIRQMEIPVSGLSHSTNENGILGESLSSYIDTNLKKHSSKRYMIKMGVGLGLGFVSVLFYRLLKERRR